MVSSKTATQPAENIATNFQSKSAKISEILLKNLLFFRCFKQTYG